MLHKSNGQTRSISGAISPNQTKEYKIKCTMCTQHDPDSLRWKYNENLSIEVIQVTNYG